MTLLLFTAAVAAWVGWWQVEQQSARLQMQIETMQKLQRKLIVHDPAQFAIIELHELWYDEDRWDVYLPPGRNYRLKLATREVDEKELPEPGGEAEISSGRHTVELLQKKLKDPDGFHLAIQVDGQTVLEAREQADWHPSRGSSDNVGYDQQKQLPVNQPLVIKRRRFMVQQSKTSASTPDGPTAGILIWIE
jgi:hypothetical protein